MKSKYKHVLITGGTRGFGLALVEAFLEKGYVVFTIARRRPARLPSAVAFLQADLTRKSHLETRVLPFVKKMGHIDVLINNVGAGAMGAIENTPLEEFRHIIETNLLSAVAMMQIALPMMRRQKSGYILNVSSAHGSLPSPFCGAYGAAKAGLNLVSEALAAEVHKFGIGVSLFHLGHLEQKSDLLFFRRKGKGNPFRAEETGIKELIEKQITGEYKPLNQVSVKVLAQRIVVIVQKSGSKSAHHYSDIFTERMIRQRAADFSGKESLSKNLRNIALLNKCGKLVQNSRKI